MKRRFISLTNAELFKMERKHEIRVEIEQYSVHGPLQKYAFKTWKKSTLREIYKIYSKLREYPFISASFSNV